MVELKKNFHIQNLMALQRNHENQMEINNKLQVLSEPALQRCSENMQQIFWKTPMPKCDFNKVAK